MASERITRERLVESSAQRRSFRERTQLLPALQALANLSVYAGLSWLLLAHTSLLVCIVAWPLLGLVLAGFLAAAHDCFHQSFLDARRANRVAGSLWCALVATNYTAARLSHLAHHRRTRVPGDSELILEFANVSGYARFLFAPLAVPRAVWKAVRILLGRLVPAHVETAAQRRDARLDAALTLGVLALAGVLTALFPVAMALVYWAPLALYVPVASAIALPEHYACGDGPDVLIATRSTRSNAFVRMLLWNSNYHVEHHLLPWVPSCNLPRVHRALAAELPHLSAGYLGFHARLVLRLLRRERAGLSDSRDVQEGQRVS